MRRNGFSLLELTVVMAVLTILVALLVPAVQSARESSRRVQCTSNLHQFGVAMHSFHDQRSMFPPGNVQFLSLHYSILPFIDQQSLGANVAQLKTSDQIQQLALTSISIFKCPSDAASSDGAVIQATNYLGNFGTGVQKFGYNGMFRSLADGKIREADVTDGLSQTAAMSESLVSDSGKNARRVVFSTPFALLKASELEQFAALCRATAEAHGPFSKFKGRPWSDGNPPSTLYNHVLFPNDASCFNSDSVQEGAYSAGSLHPGGVNVLYADGHVQFVATGIDLGVWRAAGSREGGEVLQ